jgi:hypothetical protein
MAELRIEADELVVELSELEKIGALRGDVRVPLTAVRDVRVAEDPRPELRGMRAPGTGIPGVIALGSRRGQGHDFAAVYHNRPAVVVDLEAAAFDRLVITVPDPQSTAATVRAAAAQASAQGGG